MKRRNRFDSKISCNHILL